MSDSIILVNDYDEEIGYVEKLQVHRKGQLHRAFSLFVVSNDFKVLMQKRAKNKYHSGGLWTNACCSHPGEGEDIETAVRRRVLDELGLDISDPLSFEIYKLGKFKYIKHFDEFTEYEIDHVFLMSLNNSVELHPNAEEIEELKWIDLHVLEDWILTKPDDFTAWFFAVYNMYVWKEVWNPMMMCPPISKELDSVLGQRLEDISCVGLYV